MRKSEAPRKYYYDKWQGYALGYTYDTETQEVIYAFAFKNPGDKQFIKRVAREAINIRLDEEQDVFTFKMVPSSGNFTYPRADLVMYEIFAQARKAVGAKDARFPLRFLNGIDLI